MIPNQLDLLIIGTFLLLPGGAPGPAQAKDEAGPQKVPKIVGRWDLTVHGRQADYPSWLEVRQSGYRTLVGCFVGQTGSARPISRVEFADGQVRLTVPPQWEERKDDLHFTGRLQGDLLRGETTDDKGRPCRWTARRAPALKRPRPPRWEKPIELFNGKDLTGWRPRDQQGKNAWTVRGGVLVNTAAGTDLVSEGKFTDFKVHAEFRYPRGSNSGIYLRGRYEVQIEDNFGAEPNSETIGAIYGFLTPSLNAARKAGEWQTFDITLVGRTVTVVLNGERIIDRQTIPGITGGALDSNEGAPGPLFLQGDHGIMEFRKVTLTPGIAAKKE